MICCSSLSSRAAVLVPQTAWNPWIKLWNWIAEVKRQFRSSVTVSIGNSMRPIPRKSPPSPFGIRTTVCQVLFLVSVPFQSAACTMETTFIQWVVSGSFSRVASWSHWWSRSARITGGTPEQFRWSLRSTRVVSLSSGKDSSKVNGVAPMGVGWPRDGTCRYSSTLSTSIRSMVTLDKGGRR